MEKMFKVAFTIVAGFAGLFIAFILFVVLPSIAGYVSTYYNREAIVACVNENNEEVTVKDTSNNEWVFFGTGYTEGDTVKMKMFTNYTASNINDDKIINVKIVK